MIKEQSPCPSVLLAQTKPEGLPEGFAAKKTRGQGDCSYYNTTHVNCVKQENISKRVYYWLRGFTRFPLRGFLIG